MNYFGFNFEGKLKISYLDSNSNLLGTEDVQTNKYINTLNSIFHLSAAMNTDLIPILTGFKLKIKDDTNPDIKSMGEKLGKSSLSVTKLAVCIPMSKYILGYNLIGTDYELGLLHNFGGTLLSRTPCELNF